MQRELGALIVLAQKQNSHKNLTYKCPTQWSVFYALEYPHNRS